MSINIYYEDAKRFRVESRKHSIIIDQKTEEGGTDQGMMPTELFIASLAGCIGITLIPFLIRHNISIKETKIETDYQMAENPHRIERIKTKISIPDFENLSKNIKKAIVNVAHECTIHNTITNIPEMEIDINGK